MSDKTRPMTVDKQKYINFVYKCRMDGNEIRVILDDLLMLYTMKGTTCFSGMAIPNFSKH